MVGSFLWVSIDYPPVVPEAQMNQRCKGEIRAYRGWLKGPGGQGSSKGAEIR
jgi:hypothetical protein